MSTEDEAKSTEDSEKGRVCKKLPLSSVAKYMGRAVEKDFPGIGLFKGTVTRVDHEEGLILVTYEDGDQEEFEEDEISDILVEDGASDRVGADGASGGVVPFEKRRRRWSKQQEAALVAEAKRAGSDFGVLP